MLISVTGHKSRRARSTVSGQQGVTLVELMIVLAIIGMLAGVVVLNAPPIAGNAQKESEAFAVRLERASQIAITTGTVLGIETNEAGYRFLEYRKGEWIEFSSDDLRGGRFESDLAVEFVVKDDASQNEPDPVSEDDEQDDDIISRPDILLLPTGETTPASAIFRSQRQAITVEMNSIGDITIGAVDE